MSKLELLKSASSLKDIANLLSMKPSALSYLLYKVNSETNYKSFTIPKRSGGTRLIHAPTDKLKLVQMKLSMLLQDCVDEIDNSSNLADQVAHGFKRNRSIITNARKHRNRRYVFNIDLESFFPSINFGRVRGFFLKDNRFQLAEAAATVVARIACFQNSLPQGSPCSPVISNLIAHLMDRHLVRLASRSGCTYTRYADDLTFSTNKKSFPVLIASDSVIEPGNWNPGSELTRLIDHSGFKINPEKTRMQYRDSRQVVTGLVVNKRVNIPFEYRHNVRAMVHSLFSKGYFELMGTANGNNQTVIEKRRGNLNELHGRLGFIESVDCINRRNNPTSGPSGSVSHESLYRQFLIYKDFYATPTPVVLCEGETDNIYLKFALRSQCANFPTLAELKKDKIKFKIRLYKYSKSSTSRILKLNDGGSATLSKFIGTYKKETDKFKAPGLEHPVIILYDRDEGAKAIQSAIKDASKKPFDSKAQYTHVVKNLYALPTPLKQGQAISQIEDFFEDEVKALLLGGKSLNLNNNFDVEKHYGKKLFAEHIVQAKAKSIDFSGFNPILSLLEAIVQRHKATQELA